MDRRTNDLNPGRQAHKRTNDFARVRINRDWPLGRLFQNSDRERERERGSGGANLSSRPLYPLGGGWEIGRRMDG